MICDLPLSLKTPVLTCACWAQIPYRGAVRSVGSAAGSCVIPGGLLILFQGQLSYGNVGTPSPPRVLGTLCSDPCSFSVSPLVCSLRGGLSSVQADLGFVSPTPGAAPPLKPPRPDTELLGGGQRDGSSCQVISSVYVRK